MIEVIMLLGSLVVLVALTYVLIMLLRKNEKQNNNQYEQNQDDYIEPKFKSLTPEQIEDIHSRGKITPEEKVKEWEEMNLCIPADEMWTSAIRCQRFRSCHDCLVDYSKEQDEYVPFSKK